MKAENDRIEATFAANIASVDDLIDFDQIILDLATSNLQKIAETLDSAGRVQAARDVRNRMTALQNIRTNESMKRHYGTIFSQCVVLLVSYFASATQDIFKNAAAHAFASGTDVPVTREEVKLAWRDLSGQAEDTAHVFAELLVAQKDISFQDMQSIARAFSTHFGIDIVREQHVNDIIVGQAARHVIVHGGGVVDQKMVRQLASAKPRTLKPVVTVGEHMKFVPSEVRDLALAMTTYVRNLVQLLNAKFSAPESKA